MEKLEKVLGSAIELEKYNIYKIWRDVAGAKIDENTNILKIQNDNLIVGVRDSIWLNELLLIRGEILHKIKGRTNIKKITFIIERRRTNRRVLQQKFNLKPNYDISKITLTYQQQQEIKDLVKGIKNESLRENFRKFIKNTIKKQKIAGEIK